jgi:hypothetical protein
VARRADGRDQPVHLRQGSLDGACGPYSLFMAMIVCGLVDRDDLLAVRRRDGRTRLGRVMRRLDEVGAFFQGGLDEEGLRRALVAACGKRFEFQHGLTAMFSGRDTPTFVREHVEASRPVLLKLAWGDDDAAGAHWVVVIGLEYERWSDEGRELCRFLVLDPEAPAPTVCAWNGVVDARPSRGGYWWWTARRAVRLDAAFAVRGRDAEDVVGEIEFAPAGPTAPRRS